MASASMRLIPSSQSLRDTQLLDESDGRPLYTISTSRFGLTTTIERTMGEIDSGENVATIDFNVIRSDRITLKDMEKKGEVEMKVGSEYLCKPPGAPEFTRYVASHGRRGVGFDSWDRQRNFSTSTGQAYEWRPEEDDWQVSTHVSREGPQCSSVRFSSVCPMAVQR